MSDQEFRLVLIAFATTERRTNYHATIINQLSSNEP